ncbi:MAG: hypothetical protein NVSMB32_11870 [Actinomycetota bacterium]
MSEQKKSFWSTMPGIVTSVAAIISGLAALVPIALGLTRTKPANSGSSAASSASQTASPDPAGSTPTPGADSGLPDPNPPGGSTSGGSATVVATPASLSLGQARIGAFSEASLTIANAGPGAAVISGTSITGPNASQFSIGGTSCGMGTRLPPRGSCQIDLRFTAQALGTATASLRVTLLTAQTPLTVALSGTGALL